MKTYTKLAAQSQGRKAGEVGKQSWSGEGRGQKKRGVMVASAGVTSGKEGRSGQRRWRQGARSKKRRGDMGQDKVEQ